MFLPAIWWTVKVYQSLVPFGYLLRYVALALENAGM